MLVLMLLATNRAVAGEFGFLVGGSGGWGGLGFCSRHGDTEGCTAAREAEALPCGRLWNAGRRRQEGAKEGPGKEISQLDRPALACFAGVPVVTPREDEGWLK